MLRILLLTRSRQDSVTCLIWIMQLLGMKESNHPAMKVLMDYPGLLNEEKGEIALSHLARHQRSIHQRKSREVTETNFLLLPATLRVREVMRSDALQYRQLPGYLKINPDGDEVRLTTEYFQGVIRRLTTSQFRHYDGKPEQWTSMVVAQKRVTLDDPEPFLPPTTSAILSNLYEKAKKLLAREWAGIVTAEIPEVKALLLQHLLAQNPSRSARMSPDAK